MNPARISIITVSYNSSKTIKETIESVLSQDYKDIEYIIVDGLSNDGTQEIIKSFGPQIAKFVSERDNGLYDAMNKGISLATGDIIGIINSDDIYANANVISSVASVFLNKNVDVVYGDLYYFKSGFPDTPLRYYKGGFFSLRKVRYGLMPPHPTFFIKRQVYEKYGKFDTQYSLSADFDLILRFLGVHKVPFEYVPKVLVKMRTGGKSTSSLRRTLIMNREDLHSCKKNGVKTSPFKFYLKYLIKIFHLPN
jgi:glycosyltransferase involved in cell wall biosynthesis